MKKVTDNKKIFDVWFYDLECLWSIHTASFKNRDTGEKKQFVIHPLQNDIYEYMDFLNSLLPTEQKTSVMLGFNIVKYDYPVLYYIMNEVEKYRTGFDNASNIISLIYKRSTEVMKDQWSSIPDWKTQIPQVDPFKICHYDNPAKRTSLKYIEGVLRMPIIEQYEDFDKEVKTLEEINDLLFYNDYDNQAAEKFYYQILPDIKLRQDLTVQYSINLMNADDPKLGVEIFAIPIAQELGITVKELRNKKTLRKEIFIKDCISNKIFFKTDILKNLLLKFKEKVVDSKNTKKPFEFKIDFNGVEYVFGIGGLHACIKSGRYKKNNNHKIIDIDVGSFYTALAIKLGLAPEHLGKVFSTLLEEKYNYRLSIKHIKEKQSEAGGWKLALNGTYGKSQSEFSYLYDPKYTFSITVNGQLYLMMLIEKLVKETSCQVIQVNTDGVTLLIHNDNEQLMYDVCKQWENYTELILEYAEYREMCVRDVNNYIGVYNKKDKDLHAQFPKSDWYDNNYTLHKSKGVYQVIPEANNKIAYHKNWDHRIVQKAAYDYFIKGADIKKTVMNCKDILDFCCIYKSNSTYNTIFINSNGVEEKLGKVTRYYISSGGGALKKVRKVKLKKDQKGSNEGRLQAGYSITLFNKVFKNDDFSKYNIDYTFYIKEANKLVSAIESPEQLTLNLF